MKNLTITLSLLLISLISCTKSNTTNPTNNSNNTSSLDPKIIANWLVKKRTGFDNLGNSYPVTGYSAYSCYLTLTNSPVTGIPGYYNGVYALDCGNAPHVSYTMPSSIILKFNQGDPFTIYKLTNDSLVIEQGVLSQSTLVRWYLAKL